SVPALSPSRSARASSAPRLPPLSPPHSRSIPSAPSTLLHLNNRNLALSPHQLLQFFRQLLDQLWPAMKLRWGSLEQRHAPRPLLPGGDQRLDCVDRGINLRLSRRHHADYCPKNSRIRPQHTRISDFRHIRGCHMIGE